MTDAPTEGRTSEAVRLCECGCGGSLVGYSLRAKYLPGHRQRVYRRRVRARMEAAGLPASPSLRVAEAPSPTGNRIGDAQTRRERPQRRKGGVTVSYRRVVAAVEGELARLGVPGAAAVAERAVMAALSPAARARVRGEPSAPGGGDG